MPKSLQANLLQRRQFLKTLGAAGAVAALPEAIPAAWANHTEAADMLERSIPSTGERLPVIGLGTSNVFDVGTEARDRKPLQEVLHIQLDGGGSLLDTSPMYGRSEEVAGDLIASAQARSKMFLATKVWTRGREAGLQQIETSMRLLKSKSLDLIQVHNLLDLDTHLETLRKLKEEKRIRYLGITHYTVASHADLQRVIESEPLDFVQFNYSIVTRDAEQRLLPLAAERKVATLINRPFEDGALFARVKGKALPPWAAEIDCTSWAQFFLKFIVSHPAVTCVIPATAKPDHMRDNVKAGIGRMPDQKMRERMAQHVASL